MGVGSGPPAAPTATYRLQFGPGFGFGEAQALVPYLDALGISHVYASPILKARRGSTHGYDIIDHNALNDDLGDEAAFAAFTAALRGRGMGLILDFVPNHMGIGHADNAWWLDVLEWGPDSPYAGYFDIDWQPEKRELRGKVLLPFLGDHYGTVLESGALALRFDPDTGGFSVWYHDHRFPIAPEHSARILAVGLDEMRHWPGPGLALIETLVVEFRALRGVRQRAELRIGVRAAADGLKRQLAEAHAGDADVRDHLGRCIAYFTGVPGQAASFMPLHRLLERQNYRLAYWRVAADEINYRRFFDINELAALRMERPELFETAHRTLLRWIAEGRVQGLRIDHIDGLFNPRAYCRTLLDAATAALPAPAGERPHECQEPAAPAGERPHECQEPAAPAGERPHECQEPAAPAGGFYLLVEKILAAHERLRGDWPVAGTTGYEFANLLNGLFVDGAAERGLDRAYRRFSGIDSGFDRVLHDSKLRILDSALSGELTVLARELDRISESNWRSRDFTLAGLRDGLRQVVARFPVYRAYVEDRLIHADDRRDIVSAVTAAERDNPNTDPGLFHFLRDVLTTDLVRLPGSGYGRRQVVRFAMRLQQYTGPVMAKSMEDTAFYRYHRLISLNEVGGDPRRFGIALDVFHRANEERLADHPGAMLATTTHDTKRAEDVRARIDVLTELPDEWEREVARWARLNRARKRLVAGQPAPSANDEYMIYQTLLGVWPMALVGAVPKPCAELAGLRARLETFVIKAAREAKTHSSWLSPSEDYEGALTGFIAGLLDAARPNPFLAAFVPFQARIARAGMLNGLWQTALKLTVPGVPDTYQGSEQWTLSLVDPDNRRPVDFARLAAALDGLTAPPAGERPHMRQEPAAPADPATLLDEWRDGRIKQYVTAKLLRLRRRYPQLFRDGSYIPLAVDGPRAANICAFARAADGLVAVVAVPRLMAVAIADRWAEGAALWEGSKVALPAELSGGALVDQLTGASVCAEPAGAGSVVDASGLFAHLPLAILISHHRGPGVTA